MVWGSICIRQVELSPEHYLDLQCTEKPFPNMVPDIKAEYDDPYNNTFNMYSCTIHIICMYLSDKYFATIYSVKI